MKNLTMPKIVKRGPFRFLKTQFVAKYQNKIEGDPLKALFKKKNEN